MSEQAREWSISSLSRELGVDRRTVSSRISGVAPCRKTKVGNLYKMRDVAVQVLAPGVLESDDSGIGSPEREKARLNHYQGTLKELEVKKELGQLVPTEDTERIILGVILAAKARLLALGARLTPSLISAVPSGPGAVQAVVDQAVEEILEEMASVDLGGDIAIPERSGPGEQGDGGLAAS